VDKKYINTHQHFVHKIIKDKRVVRYTVTQTWRQEQSLINKLNYTFIAEAARENRTLSIALQKL
jgi:hypothetical protein